MSHDPTPIPSGTRSQRSTRYRVVNDRGMRTNLCAHVPEGHKMPPVPKPDWRFIEDDEVQGEDEVAAE